MLTETSILAVSLLIIFGAPWLSSYGVQFQFVEHIVFRFFMAVAVLVAIRYGAMTGLVSLLAVFTLHLERNHQLLTTLPNQQPKWPRRAGQAGKPEVLPAALPSLDSHGYEPPHAEEHKAESVVETHGEKTTESEFESASDIQDNNPRLGEVAQGEAAGTFYEQKGLV